MTNFRKMLTIPFTLLLGAHLIAQEKDAVPPGFDLWKTVGGGATMMDFADAPLPSGFFGEGSEPFAGVINWEGLPIKSEPANALGGADTIVERLDWAAFDGDTAVSRLRIKALHLVSRSPLVNAYGTWEVRAGLTEKQPATEIIYTKTSASSGRFHADLVVSVRLTFTNLDDPSIAHSIDRTVHFTRFDDTAYSIHRRSDRKGDSLDGETGFQKTNTSWNTAIDTNADGALDSTIDLESASLVAINCNEIPIDLDTNYHDCIAVHTSPNKIHTTQPLNGIPDNNGHHVMSEETRQNMITQLEELRDAGTLNLVIEPDEIVDEMIAKEQK